MENFGSLTAEISWRVWGTWANFNGFRVLTSLLHRRRSTAQQHSTEGATYRAAITSGIGPHSSHVWYSKDETG